VKVRPCGDVGVLVELDRLDDALGLASQVAELDLEGVVDLVPATRTLLVRFDPAATTLEAISRRVRALDPTAGDPPDAGEIEIPVTYDGEDLHQVAELTGLAPREVVAAHTGQAWTVAFAGFAPGFGYLAGEDDRLHVPRRSEPRSAVPVGAVALADNFSGVYPRRSPGGWQLIGRTDLAMWDLERDPPALLEPGTTVRFVEVRSQAVSEERS
jgi:KipI family sensor histidine kinase inhibitor